MLRRKRDITLTLALCLSLIVHAWIVHAASWRYVRDNARLYLPGITRLPEIALVPVAAPRPQPPPEPPMFDPMEQLGDSNADTPTGATAAMPGDEPLRAPQASQAQAALSLDPRGAGDGGQRPIAGPASPAARPPSPVFDPVAESAALRLPQDSSVAQPKLARTTPVESTEPTDASDEPSKAVVPPVIALVEPGEEAENSFKAPAPRRQPPQSIQPAQSLQAAARPSPPPSPPTGGASAADPAPLAESESDAFTTEAGADFTSGRIIPRVGRKHKIIRPKLEMAGYADLMQLRGPIIIVLNLHIDVTGQVEKVEIIKSSGSINLDQPTLIAAYRWWFEPIKDSAGRPKKDVIRFTCRFV
jgi:TonB family protein